jgi:transcription initiation factor TFIID subunit 1, fungi type
MQVGVQRLNDLGLAGGKDDDDKDIDENANIELQLAPWRATKNFIQATQGKAMLKLHGEGDPTGRGEGFSFVKTSMKGGFEALGQSISDKLDAKRRKENGGHTYNVAKQQKQYDDYIRMIWERQKNSLSSNIEMSDDEMEDDPDADTDAAAFGRAGTPRSSFAGTPVPWNRRADDETGTQFSKASADRGNGRVLVINRSGGRDAFGQAADHREKITNPKVIREYIKRKNQRRLESIESVSSLFFFYRIWYTDEITAS